MVTGFDLKPWLRPNVLLIAMATLCGVAGVVFGGLVVASDRDDTLAAASIEVGTRARLLDEHVRHLLDVADLTLLRLADLPATHRPAQGPALIAPVPDLANLMLLSPTARLVADTAALIPPGSDLSGRDWVVAAGRAKAGVSVLGRAQQEGVGGPSLMAVARRLPDGQIAAAGIEVEHFRHIHQRLPAEPDIAMGIETLAGVSLLRRPLGAASPGGLPADARPDGVRVVETGDGPRLVAVRSVPQRDLLVWVSLSKDGVLAPWRARSLRLLAAVAGAVLLMVGLSVQLMRQWARDRVSARDLESLNRELGRSNADLEQFAYVASHDLKEPLRNISSYVQLLQRRYQGKLDSDADAFIGYTVEGVTRMQAIIHELLAYSRIGTGHVTRQPVQTGAAVATALGQLKTAIAEAQAAVEVKGPLPVVVGDPVQLGSLFQNLIANGIKYRRPDVRPEVTIGVEDRGQEWAFYVRDNGIGIDSQYHHQIFELFKRLHPRAHYQGTGIGLSVCKRVVERHGGHIWVESKPGQGATFWFALPRSKELD